MPKEIDEDLIEATIRRVQQQAVPSSDADESDSAPFVETEEDDPIEATIRRVHEQAARAAQAASPEPEATEANDLPPSSPSGGYDAIEETIRRVRTQAAAQATEAEDAGEDAESPPPAADDPFAETIRRVQAQAAARSHDESADFAPPPMPELDDDDDAQVGPGVAAPMVLPQPTPMEATSWPGRDERLLGEPASWEVAAARLEQGLQDNSRQVRELAAKLDAMLPALQELLGGSAQAKGLSVIRDGAATDDDDWDQRPAAPVMQFGPPPRPAVLRDPAPQTATALQLEEVEAAPAARLRAVDASTFEDRLPRQYRITVEDKRRGVDLVPLHRAMQGLENVRDMSLLSYSNGVAIVLVETIGALDPDGLCQAVARSMAREARIEVHNESTMVVKVQED